MQVSTLTKPPILQKQDADALFERAYNDFDSERDQFISAKGIGDDTLLAIVQMRRQGQRMLMRHLFINYVNAFVELGLCPERISFRLSQDTLHVEAEVREGDEATFLGLQSLGMRMAGQHYRYDLDLQTEVHVGSQSANFMADQQLNLTA